MIRILRIGVSYQLEKNNTSTDFPLHVLYVCVEQFFKNALPQSAFDFVARTFHRFFGIAGTRLEQVFEINEFNATVLEYS